MREQKAHLSIPKRASAITAEGVEEVQHFYVLSEERLQQILAGELDECSNLQVLFLIGILTRGSSPHPLILHAFTTSDVAFTTSLIRLSVFSLVPIQESMYAQGYRHNKLPEWAINQHPS